MPATGRVDGTRRAWAFGLNVLYLGLAGSSFARMLERVREKGHLGRLGME